MLSPWRLDSFAPPALAGPALAEPAGPGAEPALAALRREAPCWIVAEPETDASAALAQAARGLEASGLPVAWFGVSAWALDPGFFWSGLARAIAERLPEAEPTGSGLLAGAPPRPGAEGAPVAWLETVAALASGGLRLVLALEPEASPDALAPLAAALAAALPAPAGLTVVAPAPEAGPPPAFTALRLPPDAAGRRARWEAWAAASPERLQAWRLPVAIAAHLPAVDPGLWEAAADALAPWPSEPPPPLFDRFGPADAPAAYRLSEAGRRLWAPEALRGAEVADLLRRTGVAFAAKAPLEAVRAFLAVPDLAQAEAVAVPAGEALLANYHYEALRRLLDSFPEAHRARSTRLKTLQADRARVLGDATGALEAYQQAEVLARARGDGRGLSRALAGQSTLHAMQGDERAYRLAGEALAAAPESDAAGRGQAYNLLGIFHMQANELSVAAPYLEEALRLFAQTGDPGSEAKALVNLGLYHSKAGRFDKASARYAEAIARTEAAGKVPTPTALTNLSRIRLLLGDLAGAWDAAERALKAARLLGTRRERADAEWTFGEVMAQRGDQTKARRYFEASRQSARAGGDAIAEANALASLAEVAMREGAPHEAQALLAEAVSQRKLPLSDPAAFALAEVVGRVHLELGELAEAEALLVPIQRYMARAGNKYFQASVEFALGHLYEAQGDMHEAARMRGSATAITEAYGYAHLRRMASIRPHERRAIVPASADALGVELELRLFGPFEGRLDAAPHESLGRSKKLQQLLAYLLLNPEGLARDDFGDLFEGGDMKASAALMLVSRLRQTLEPDAPKHQSSRYVLLEDGRYRFNPAVRTRCDAEDFLAHLAQARAEARPAAARLASLQQALALYRGPFLAGCEDAWAQAERERFRRLAGEAAGALCETLLAQNDPTGALQWAERALKQDFLNMAAHEAKLRALARLGRREEVLRHFKRAEAHWLKKYAVGPSDALVSTYQGILRGVVR